MGLCGGKPCRELNSDHVAGPPAHCTDSGPVVVTRSELFTLNSPYQFKKIRASVPPRLRTLNSKRTSKHTPFVDYLFPS